MRALMSLTAANIRSYTRDRAALFWTLAFPLIFIFMFGLIFQGGGTPGLSLGWADEDGSPAAATLREAFDGLKGVEVVAADREASLASMRDGKVDAVIVVPAGYGAAIGSGQAGSAGPTAVVLYTDPSRS